MTERYRLGGAAGRRAVAPLRRRLLRGGCRFADVARFLSAGPKFQRRQWVALTNRKPIHNFSSATVDNPMAHRRLQPPQKESTARGTRAGVALPASPLTAHRGAPHTSGAACAACCGSFGVNITAEPGSGVYPQAWSQHFSRVVNRFARDCRNAPSWVDRAERTSRDSVRRKPARRDDASLCSPRLLKGAPARRLAARRYPNVKGARMCTRAQHRQIAANAEWSSSWIALSTWFFTATSGSSPPRRRFSREGRTSQDAKVLVSLWQLGKDAVSSTPEMIRLEDPRATSLGEALSTGVALAMRRISERTQ